MSSERIALARLSAATPGLGRPAMLALAAHVAAAATLATLPLLRLAPDRTAQIEIMVGTDARQTGAMPPPTLAPPSEPAPRLTSPASPPTQPAQPASSPAPPSDGAAPPVTQPEPPPDAIAQAAAPAGTNPDRGAEAAPPVMAQPAPPIAPSASATPAASPQETSEGTAQGAAGVPDIRIGDGIAAAAAEIEGAGLVHPATSQVGNVAPAYPIEAARRRERGTVVLRIFIAADGSVDRVAVLQSSGSELLDRAARDRIATWHFDPALRDGRAVPDVEEQSIRFVPD